MKRVLIILIAIISSISLYANEKITIVTEEYPPYNFTNSDGKIDGLGTEILFEILDELDYEYTIEVYPWARAYKMAQTFENVLIYTISKTEERENQFKWIGAAGPINQCVFARKDEEIIINNEMDLHNYVGGVIREDISAHYLKSIGVDNYSEVTYIDQNIRKLKFERIDYLIYNEIGFYYELEKIGEDRSRYKKVYDIESVSGNTYMAFSKKTSDEIVNDFIRAYEKIIDSGKYDEIVKKYIK